MFGGAKKKSGGHSTQKCTELVLAARLKLDKKKKIDKEIELLFKSLESIKLDLIDSSSSAATYDEISKDLDFLGSLIDNITLLSFESRKDFVSIFSIVLHKSQNQSDSGSQSNSNSNIVSDYMLKNSKLIDSLIHSYQKPPDVAKFCGQILRLCIESEKLTNYIIYSSSFILFFSFVVDPDFDISSDAFTTFKDLLTTHKSLSAAFLESHYEVVFENFTKLLGSDNYVTRRQTLKLLGELLLDRANFNVMTKYISEKENLILMMNLLRDKSKNIQFEAFHVFKVFVANPHKVPPILDILIRNKTRLIQFLNDFHNDKSDDETFTDEKAFLIKQIEQLPSHS
eukprot:TRINITY_DN4074_c0_g1_i1.p1 TRINITY_DN4074_c0_g1~~TRINITY_DN4074_c0_g1_i1.p1  ORF type:complete len:341 (+),score=82.13 TRINITY_DN4074_c0_g1_i1:240-1262(+)